MPLKYSLSLFLKAASGKDELVLFFVFLWGVFFVVVVCLLPFVYLLVHLFCCV